MSAIANVKLASGTTQALTRANARKLAQNRDAGWGITTIQTLSATQLLFAIEYAMFNSQAAIGNGVVNATETIRTGSTSSLGNTSGSVESSGVSYRGEENLWGNMYTWVDGISGDYKTSTSQEPLIVDGNITNLYECRGFGFWSALSYSDKYDNIFIGSEINGTSAIPIGAGSWNSAAGSRSCTIRVSGDYTRLFSVDFSYGVSNNNASTTARLIYIPQPAQEVTTE